MMTMMMIAILMATGPSVVVADEVQCLDSDYSVKTDTTLTTEAIVPMAHDTKQTPRRRPAATEWQNMVKRANIARSWLIEHGLMAAPLSRSQSALRFVGLASMVALAAVFPVMGLVGAIAVTGDDEAVPAVKRLSKADWIAMKEQQAEDQMLEIIGPLFDGELPQWSKPWEFGGTQVVRPLNADTGREYRGANVWNLSGFTIPIFATKKQWYKVAKRIKFDFSKATGEDVFKQFEECSPRLIWTPFKQPIYVDDGDKKDAQGNPKKKRIWVVKKGAGGMTIGGLAEVYNITDTNLPVDAVAETIDFALSQPDFGEVAGAEDLDALVRANLDGVKLAHADLDRACYASWRDEITMPFAALFKDNGVTQLESYTATLMHEAAHASGHRLRLARPLQNTFGDTAYAREELVAEMASVMAMRLLGMEINAPHHGKYLGGWANRVLGQPSGATNKAAWMDECRKVLAEATKASEWVLFGTPDWFEGAKTTEGADIEQGDAPILNRAHAPTERIYFIQERDIIGNTYAVKAENWEQALEKFDDHEYEGGEALQDSWECLGGLSPKKVGMAVVRPCINALKEQVISEDTGQLINQFKVKMVRQRNRDGEIFGRYRTRACFNEICMTEEVAKKNWGPDRWWYQDSYVDETGECRECRERRSQGWIVVPYDTDEDDYPTEDVVEFAAAGAVGLLPALLDPTMATLALTALVGAVMLSKAGGDDERGATAPLTIMEWDIHPTCVKGFDRLAKRIQRAFTKRDIEFVYEIGDARQKFSGASWLVPVKVTHGPLSDSGWTALATIEPFDPSEVGTTEALLRVIPIGVAAGDVMEDEPTDRDAPDWWLDMTKEERDAHHQTEKAEHRQEVALDTMRERLWSDSTKRMVYDPTICDHCGVRSHNRKKLVIVEHEHGRRRIVGSSCLFDYTNIDPKTLEYLFTIHESISPYEGLETDPWSWTQSIEKREMSVFLDIIEEMFAVQGKYEKGMGRRAMSLVMGYELLGLNVHQKSGRHHPLPRSVGLPTSSGHGFFENLDRHGAEIEPGLVYRWKQKKERVSVFGKALERDDAGSGWEIAVPHDEGYQQDLGMGARAYIHQSMKEAREAERPDSFQQTLAVTSRAGCVTHKTCNFVAGAGSRYFKEIQKEARAEANRDDLKAFPIEEMNIKWEQGVLATVADKRSFEGNYGPSNVLTLIVDDQYRIKAFSNAKPVREARTGDVVEIVSFIPTKVDEWQGQESLTVRSLKIKTAFPQGDEQEGFNAAMLAPALLLDPTLTTLALCAIAGVVLMAARVVFDEEQVKEAIEREGIDMDDYPMVGEGDDLHGNPGMRISPPVLNHGRVTWCNDDGIHGHVIPQGHIDHSTPMRFCPTCGLDFGVTLSVTANREGGAEIKEFNAVMLAPALLIDPTLTTLALCGIVALVGAVKSRAESDRPNTHRVALEGALWHCRLESEDVAGAALERTSEQYRVYLHGVYCGRIKRHYRADSPSTTVLSDYPKYHRDGYYFYGYDAPYGGAYSPVRCFVYESSDERIDTFPPSAEVEPFSCCESNAWRFTDDYQHRLDRASKWVNRYTSGMTQGHNESEMERFDNYVEHEVDTTNAGMDEIRNAEGQESVHHPAIIGLGLLLDPTLSTLLLCGLVGVVMTVGKAASRSVYDSELLAFGVGVDSSCLLAMHLNRDATCEYLGIDRATLDKHLPLWDAAVFSDTGAEWDHTYANLAYAQEKCEEAGFELVVVRNEKRGPIDEWHKERGVVPFFNGGKHTCSKIWKQEPMHKWAAERYGKGAKCMWSVGIAANENGRLSKFNGLDKKAADDGQYSRFPLTDLGITRVAAQDILRHLDWMPEGDEVSLSACYHCPYNTEADLRMLREKYPDLWVKAVEMEEAFLAASTAKHQKWLDEGQPLVKFGKTKAGVQKFRAPAGMWRDDYANRPDSPQRLIQRTGPTGELMSMEEWGEYIDSNVLPVVEGQARLSEYTGCGGCPSESEEEGMWAIAPLAPLFLDPTLSLLALCVVGAVWGCRTWTGYTGEICQCDNCDGLFSEDEYGEHDSDKCLSDLKEILYILSHDVPTGHDGPLTPQQAIDEIKRLRRDSKKQISCARSTMKKDLASATDEVIMDLENMSRPLHIVEKELRRMWPRECHPNPISLLIAEIKRLRADVEDSRKKEKDYEFSAVVALPLLFLDPSGLGLGAFIGMAFAALISMQSKPVKSQTVASGLREQHYALADYLSENEDKPTPSDEQMAFINDYCHALEEWVEDGSTGGPRMVCEAVAGSGKTFVLKIMLDCTRRIEASLVTRASAFNRHIAQTMKDVLKALMKDGFTGAGIIGGSNSVQAGGAAIVRGFYEKQGVTVKWQGPTTPIGDQRWRVLSKLAVTERMSQGVIQSAVTSGLLEKPNQRPYYNRIVTDVTKTVKALTDAGYIPEFDNENVDLSIRIDDMKELVGRIAGPMGLNEICLHWIGDEAWMMVDGALRHIVETAQNPAEITVEDDCLVPRLGGYTTDLAPLSICAREANKSITDFKVASGLFWPPREEEEKARNRMPTGSAALSLTRIEGLRGALEKYNGKLLVQFGNGRAANASMEGDDGEAIPTQQWLKANAPGHRNGARFGNYWADAEGLMTALKQEGDWIRIIDDHAPTVDLLARRFSSLKGGFSGPDNDHEPVPQNDTMLLSFADQVFLPNYLDLYLEEKWDVVFIDELQDLSEAKSQLIWRCIDTDHSAIICVGDRKQSIYFWSGASTEAFDDAAEYIGATRYPMTISWRGSTHVAEAAKAICEEGLKISRAVQPDADYPDYSEHTAPSFDGWREGGRTVTIDHSQIADAVKHIRESEYPLSDTEKPIAVLSYLTGALGGVIIQLVKAGIPITTPAGDQGIVTTVCNLLNKPFYDQLTNKKQKNGVGFNRLGDYSEYAIMSRLERVGRMEFDQAVKRANGDHKLAEKDDYYNEVISILEMAECLIELWYPFTGMAQWPDQNLTVAQFKNWCNNVLFAAKGDSVHLSTVHKFKGDEAGVVFLLRGVPVKNRRTGETEVRDPFLLEHLLNQSPGTAVEQMNVLYVAATRAQDQTIIVKATEHASQTENEREQTVMAILDNSWGVESTIQPTEDADCPECGITMPICGCAQEATLRCGDCGDRVNPDDHATCPDCDALLCNHRVPERGAKGGRLSNAGDVVPNYTNEKITNKANTGRGIPSCGWFLSRSFEEMLENKSKDLDRPCFSCGGGE